MSEWKEYKLGKLYNVSSGLSKAADQFGFGYTFISFKDVFWNYFIPENPEGLVNSNEKDQSSCNVSLGDILITRTSESLEEVGMASVALKDYPNSTFNGFSKRLRLKKNAPIEISPLFMGYLLRTRFFRKSVANYATMTTRASLNGDSIKSIPLFFPPYDLQNEIGKTLHSLDKKVILLRQQNQDLEELAQTLFKRWFVEFEFPNENGEPYLSSGGKMVESELGEIPEGWRVTQLEEVATLIAGGDKPKNASPIQTKECNVPIYSNGIKDDGLYGFTNKARIKEESITVSARGTIGFISLKNQPYVPIVRLIAVVPIEPKMTAKFLYLWLKKQSISGTGTTQQQLTIPQFKGFEVLVPKYSVLKQFTRTLDAFYNKKSCNTNEIQTLTQLRDTLLPKLMSGEIRIL